MNCPNCGSKMEPSWRCCFSCGALNINHEQNKGIVIPEVTNEEPKDEFVIEEINDNNEVIINSPSLPKDNSDMICWIINAIILLVLEIIIIKFSKADLAIAFAVVSFVLYFYFFCFQKLLFKAGLPWWGAFVPIYNVYLMYILCLRDSTLFKLTLILPILCFILTFIGVFFKLIFLIKFTRVILIIFSVLSEFISVLMLWSLGKRFGRSGLITLLFGFIVIPTLAFSKKYQYEY